MKIDVLDGAGLSKAEIDTSAQIIWDLSSQLGEAKHKIKMLEWKLEEMRKILE